MRKIKITQEQYNRIINKPKLAEHKKTVKITKEQYQRLISAGLIQESDVKVIGGADRVDKTFKQALGGTNINKPVTEGSDNLKDETIKLIQYLYRKTDEFSTFWSENGLTFDKICDALKTKGIIINKNGKYELSKKLGSPQAAIQTVEDELKSMIEPSSNKEGEIEEMDNYNYPEGSDTPDAPWNQPEDDFTEPTIAENPELKVVAINREIAILQAPDGSLYAFYYYDTPKAAFMDYASVSRRFVGKDEDGDPEYEYDEDFDIDADVVGNYVNYNLADLSKGEGMDDFEQGQVDLVKIDDELKQDLLSVYDKDKGIVSVLSQMNEDVVDDFYGNLRKAYNEPSRRPDPNETPEEKEKRLKQALSNIRGKEEIRRKERGEVEEMTGAASSGAFTPAMDMPVVKRKMPETPVVGETATVASAGNFQYDTPGGLTMDLGKNNPKTKAEKTTQWAGGSFVKQPDCSKMNNNKSAQNGGCNSGASSLKTVKTGGSINAPSIGEQKIYEMIAKKTGKTIEEVKRIIASKNNKAL